MSRKRSTIYQLRPDPPFICGPDDTIAKASASMTNNRVHCVIVMSNGKFVGLFTAKDLAFRVVAKGLDPDVTKIQNIMTRSPLCLHMDTPTTDALQFMVERQIRHLPLLDNDGNIKGVLDITRCFYQAMLRLEKIASNAQKLKEILNDVAENYEDLRNKEAERISKDIEKLTTLIEVPTLKTLIPNFQAPIYIKSNESVRSASELMVSNNNTAILVYDGTSKTQKIIGIFTSKDICFRVLSKNYDAENCTVARVLTTNPEFAKPSMNISSALRLMYQGHFLNLPVMDDSNNVIGMISVLQLIYAALKQLGQENDEDRSFQLSRDTFEEVNRKLREDQTPIWDTFWNSLEKSTDDIHSLESSVSGASPTRSRSISENLQMNPGSRVQSSTGRKSSLNEMIMSGSRRSSFNKKLYDDTDSIIQRKRSTESRASFYLRRKTVTFKIKLQGERTHKISVIVNNKIAPEDDIPVFKLLKHEISERLGIDTAVHKLHYELDSGKLVQINDEADLMNAIDISEERFDTYVTLIIKKQSWISSLWNLFTSALNNLTQAKIPHSPSMAAGALGILSIGILMGYSIKR